MEGRLGGRRVGSTLGGKGVAYEDDEVDDDEEDDEAEDEEEAAAGDDAADEEVDVAGPVWLVTAMSPFAAVVFFASVDTNRIKLLS